MIIPPPPLPPSLPADITKDEDQLLYRSCIALNASTLTQCSHPVTDVLAKDSICTKHAKTGVSLVF